VNGILNKMTLEKFDQLIEKFMALPIGAIPPSRDAPQCQIFGTVGLFVS
jgi:hypothetical protein